MSRFKTLDDMGDVTGKRVLVREDLNVPMADGQVTDDTRLRAAAPTLLELADRGAKVLVLAHFGRPKGTRNDAMSLRQVVPALSAVLGRSVDFIDDCAGDAAAAKVTADSDAKNIRAALGDIASERARILAEADAQAASVLAEGRVRITAEIAELEAKAEADINAARGRGSDELRNEITVLASRATPLVVAATLNDQVHKDLVESFISKVGAGK